MGNEKDVLEKLTTYKQVPLYDDLSGKTIKYSSIGCLEVTIVFTDKTYIHADGDGDGLYDCPLSPGYLEAVDFKTHQKRISDLGEALEVTDLEPYHEYLQEKDKERTDREYKEYLRLKEKYDGNN